MSDSLQLHGLYSPWNSPGKNTGVGSHSLLQGIFPTQGTSLSHSLLGLLNPGKEKSTFTSAPDEGLRRPRFLKETSCFVHLQFLFVSLG